MPIGSFTILLATLYLLETAFIPGLFTQDAMLHISLLLLLAFIYQAWNNWVAGFLVFTLLLPLTFGETRITFFCTYLGLISVSYLLIQSVLSTRSLSSYLVYVVIIASILSTVHTLTLQLPFNFFVTHWIFSSTFLLFVRSAFPVRTRTSLSTL